MPKAINGNIPEIYRGVEIKKYNKIQLRVSTFEFKKFIDAKLDKGLSARQVIQISCSACSNADTPFGIFGKKK